MWRQTPRAGPVRYRYTYAHQQSGFSSCHVQNHVVESIVFIDYLLGFLAFGIINDIKSLEGIYSCHRHVIFIS